MARAMPYPLYDAIPLVCSVSYGLCALPCPSGLDVPVLWKNVQTRGVAAAVARDELDSGGADLGVGFDAQVVVVGQSLQASAAGFLDRS